MNKTSSCKYLSLAFYFRVPSIIPIVSSISATNAKEKKETTKDRKKTRILSSIYEFMTIISFIYFLKVFNVKSVIFTIRR